MKIAVFVIVGTILGSFPSLWAGFEWERKIIEVDATVDDRKVEVLYRFTNTGEKAVEIGAVRTSCGCTTADLPKKVYEPGESGELPVIFDIGNRKGVQRKSIRMETSEGVEVLNLVVTIPTLIEYQPRVLFWRRNEAVNPKSVSISIESELVEGIRLAESSVDGFEYELQQTTKGYELIVEPATDGTASGRLTLEILLEGRDAMEEVVYLRKL